MRWSLLVTLCFLSGHVSAQEKPNYLLKKKQTNQRDKESDCSCDKKAKPKAPPSAWEKKLKLGAIFQYNNSRGVIGRLDGTSRSLTLKLHGEANWQEGNHSVRNRIDARGVVVKTQNTGRWVPASDYIELESIYQYHFLHSLGPFARAGFDTSMFIGRDLRTNAVRYELPDGSFTGERTELRLTDAFKPMTFIQSVGVFYNPVHEANFDIDIRSGLGMRETIADNQLGVKDEAQTRDIVEIVELNSYIEAGLEFIVMLRGELFNDRFAYFAGGEFLLPFIRTRLPDDNRSNTELISKIFRAGLAFKLAKNATIIYELRLVHKPQLVDIVQVQNDVGLKANFDLL